MNTSWLSQWIADQWRALPEERTEAAHGKADILRALTAEVDRREDAWSTRSRGSYSGEEYVCPHDPECGDVCTGTVPA